jgi:hypothetical protein
MNDLEISNEGAGVISKDPRKQETNFPLFSMGAALSVSISEKKERKKLN